MTLKRRVCEAPDRKERLFHQLRVSPSLAGNTYPTLQVCSLATKRARADKISI